MYRRLSKLVGLLGLSVLFPLAALGQFQSGHDVGRYCAVYSNYSVFRACCDAGCASLHPIGDYSGWLACMAKCTPYFPGLACVPDPNPVCPAIYAPVTCADGITYSNQCFADAACVDGCVPAE